MVRRGLDSGAQRFSVSLKHDCSFHRAAARSVWLPAFLSMCQALYKAHKSFNFLILPVFHPFFFSPIRRRAGPDPPAPSAVRTGE